MKKEQFYFHVPEELIAQHPLDQRDASRLLVAKAQDRHLDDSAFCHLSTHLNQIFHLEETGRKVLLVLNDTKVYPARVRVRKATGARGEVFFLEKEDSQQSYSCLLRPKSKLKLGDILYADQEPNTPLFSVCHLGDEARVSLVCKETLSSVLQRYGEMPLPPYIVRDPKKVSFVRADQERYQTVYSAANHNSSAAAPTAGLHFTEEMMERCRAHNVEFTSLTLNIGLGTFAPLQKEDIADHSMHGEYFCVPDACARFVGSYLSRGWPIVFVGTTALRAMESFFRMVDKHSPHWCQDKNKITDILLPFSNHWYETKLFIYPTEERERILPLVGNGIVTNFHQPESTLALLISALLGYDFWKVMYSHALEKKYRFFSYGDSNLIVFRET